MFSQAGFQIDWRTLGWWSYVIVRERFCSINLKTFERNIKVIHLEFNEIQFISDSIGALQNLKQLYPNRFRTLKAIANSLLGI